MDVHAHDNLRTGELAEGMLDAVGDVGGQTHLCLHLHIGGTGLLLQLFQQLQPLLHGAWLPFVVVIDHVEGHQSAVELLVAHHDGEFEQLRGYLGILHAEQDLLVVDGCWPLACWCCRGNDDLLAACSVMSVEMMQVTRIMMTTPLSISSLTR